MPNDTIPNIGPRQRRLRAVFGVVALAVATGVAFAPHVFGVAPGLRFGSLPIYFGGFLGLLQARDKT